MMAGGQMILFDLPSFILYAQGLVHVPWELHNDGRPHTYSVPLHEYFQVLSAPPIPDWLPHIPGARVTGQTDTGLFDVLVCTCDLADVSRDTGHDDAAALPPRHPHRPGHRRHQRSVLQNTTHPFQI